MTLKKHNAYAITGNRKLICWAQRSAQVSPTILLMLNAGHNWASVLYDREITAQTGLLHVEYD